MPHPYCRITAVFASAKDAQYAISLLNQLPRQRPNIWAARLRQEADLAVIDLEVKTCKRERALTLLRGAHGIPTEVVLPRTASPTIEIVAEAAVA